MTDGVKPKHYLTMQDRIPAENFKESSGKTVANGHLAWIGKAVMQGIYILFTAAVILIVLLCSP
jgi:hypothetical protein